jgi:hypothetical protein
MSSKDWELVLADIRDYKMVETFPNYSKEEQFRFEVMGTTIKTLKDSVENITDLQIAGILKGLRELYQSV